MHQLRCPHCGDPAVSVLRKLFLGPALPARCRNCARRVGVPYVWSLLALAPMIPLAVWIRHSHGSMPAALGAIVGFVCVCYLYVRFVPLEKR